MPDPDHDATTNAYVPNASGDTTAPETERATPGEAYPSIAGYDILGVLGRGGMGVVYRARQRALKRVVALKMILAGGQASAHERERFRLEAEAVARLVHPNIVQLYEVGESEGRPYCVLELVSGGALKQRLAEVPLAARAAAELVEKLARAMADAHAKGIIHRDLKPGNILLDAAGEPKVTDFGLAKLVDVEDGPTRTGAVLGTPSYMAPEQAAGKKEVGPAADIYALGAILYECLTGRPPFKAATLLETLDQVRHQEPVSPRSLNRTVPRDLETICLKCLRKEPARRYASAQALADDLRRFRDGEPVHARPVGVVGRLVRWCARNRAVALLLAAVFITLTAGAVTATLLAFQAQAESKEKDKALTTARQTARERTEALACSNIRLALSEWNQGNLDRARDTLALIPDDCANYECAYLRRNFEGGYVTLYGHLQGVETIAFHPDGTLLASGSHDGTVRLWDARTGAEVGRLLGDGDSVEGVAFSPDGRRLAAASQWGTVSLWDLDTGEEVDRLDDQTSQIFKVAYSPDGRLLATAGFDGKARVWDLDTNTLRRHLTGHTSSVRCVAFSPDGARLATGGGDSTARVWDVASGRELLVLGGHGSWVDSIAYSPDGTQIATGSMDLRPGGGAPGAVRLWDARTGRLLHTLRGHEASVRSLAFSPAGRYLASGGFDGTVRLWDAYLGVGERVLRGHASWVQGLAFSPDGQRLATASYDLTIRLWDSRTTQVSYALQGPGGRGVQSIAYSPDGRRLATAAQESGVQVWDARGTQELLRLTSPGRPWQVAFSPDGATLAACCDDHTARLWEAVTGQELLRLSGHEGSVRTLAFSPAGDLLATGSSDRTIRLWNPRTGEQGRTLLGHAGEVTSVAFSPDGKLLASGSDDRTVRLWDPASGRELHTCAGHAAHVYRVAFSPDGQRLASSSDDLTVRLWSTDDGTEKTRLRLQRPGALNRGARGLAFSPLGKDGTHRQTLATGDERAVRLWDARTGEELLTLALTDPDYQVTALAFSPDGTRLAATPEHSPARIFDARPLPTVTQLRGHLDSVTSVTFSPDSRRVATASSDNTARVWDARTGEQLQVLTQEQFTNASVRFSADGCQLYGQTLGKRWAWNLSDGALANDEPPEWPAVDRAAVSPDGRLMALHWGPVVELHDRTLAPDADELAYRAALTNLDRKWHATPLTGLLRERRWFATDFHATLALRVRPDAEVYRERGHARAEMGRWAEARADFAAAVARAPKDLAAHRGLAGTELALSNDAGYKTACAALIKRFGSPMTCDVIALLAAPPGDPFGRLALQQAAQSKHYERSQAGQPLAAICTWADSGIDPALLLLLAGSKPEIRGPALYRVGRYDQAAQVLAGQRDKIGVLYCALAEFRRGRKEAGAQALKLALTWLDKPTPQAGDQTTRTRLPWDERQDVERLLREVAALAP